MCGFPKDLFYYYQAWWSEKPVLHLFPHWNWAGKEGQDIEVWCFTNADRVELVVNGTSAGEQDVKRDSHVVWKIPFVAGAIEARGTKAGHPELIDRRETTGAPAKIALVPDRPRISADGEDLCVVVAQVVDAQGRVVPTAADEVTFEIGGPGSVIGVGNGDPSSHEPDRASKRRAFNGLCMALVQSQKTPGEIRVSASAPGLTGASAAIASEATTVRPAL
jgi:beta-galactosidase